MLVTNFVIRVRKFVIHVTKFVTKNSYRIVKNICATVKIILLIIKTVCAERENHLRGKFAALGGAPNGVGAFCKTPVMCEGDVPGRHYGAQRR